MSENKFNYSWKFSPRNSWKFSRKESKKLFNIKDVVNEPLRRGLIDYVYFCRSNVDISPLGGSHWYPYWGVVARCIGIHFEHIEFEDILPSLLELGKKISAHYVHQRMNDLNGNTIYNQEFPREVNFFLGELDILNDAKTMNIKG